MSGVCAKYLQRESKRAEKEVLLLGGTELSLTGAKRREESRSEKEGIYGGSALKQAWSVSRWQWWIQGHGTVPRAPKYSFTSQIVWALISEALPERIKKSWTLRKEQFCKGKWEEGWADREGRGARNLCRHRLEHETLKWSRDFIYKEGSDWIPLLGVKATLMKKHLLWF